MGTGNARAPTQWGHRTANALDVVGGDSLGARPSVREERGFVAWPPTGYVPANVVWGRWSFSLADADFSSASVEVSDDAGAVAVEILDRVETIAEPGIVWAVADDSYSRLLSAPTDGDRCYSVTVSGVVLAGETQPRYEYPVCVLDPRAPTGPKVTLDSSSAGPVGGRFDVAISFSDPVHDFTQSDIFVVNGTVTDLTGWGRNYAAEIRADDNGLVVVSVVGGAVHDERYRPNVPSVPLRVTVDVGRPTVVVAVADPTDDRRDFDLDIKFSEPVTGFSTSGVSVVNGTLTTMGGSVSSYRATVTQTSDGAVVVRVAQDAAVAASGRANLASAPLAWKRPAASGPGIDTWDRAAVLEAHTVEFGRDEPDWGYTGDVDNCVAGTTSEAFRNSMIARLNWYRQMVGLRPVVTNAALSSHAQRSALIHLANGDFSVTGSSKCYATRGASTVGGHSWLGIAGLAAIDAYWRESHSASAPSLSEVGFGVARDTASLYRVSQQIVANHLDPWRTLSPVREPRGFVAWPPSGYAPRIFTQQRWSFSLPDADFSAAVVEMADHSGRIEIEILDTISWYRQNTLLWEIDPESLTRQTGPTDADHCFEVTVRGVTINGTAQPPYEYAVCALDLSP